MEETINTLYRLLPYLKKHKYMLLSGFVFIVLHNYGYMKVPEYMKKILNEITKNNDFDNVLQLVLIVIFYTLFTALFMFLMRKTIIGVSRKIEFELRNDLYEKLLELDTNFYLTNRTGDLTSRCTNDLNDVRTLLGPGLMYVPNSLTRFLLFFPVLLSLNKQLMIYITVVLIFLIIIIFITMPHLKPLFLKIQEATGEVSSASWQIISGITAVKLNNLENNETEKFKNINKNYVKANMDLVKWRGFLWPFFIFVLSLAELLVLYFGGSEVINGNMTVGELLQFNIMIAYLTFPVLSLGWIMSLIQQGISAMGRINYILEQSTIDKLKIKEIEKDTLFINIRNLTFRYPNAEKEVLSNVSFKINPFETVGITGTVGSGKTTLANIISGILKPENNMVFVNNIDINTIKNNSIFEKVAVVPQEPFLFSKTLKENIALGGKIEDSKIESIIETSGLKSDVERFQNKINQLIGENGITLSGGQIQRTAIARALIRENVLTIFDDALSSVDAKTENEILGNLKGYLNDKNNKRTFILISHRISALKQTDRIIVLDDGKIVQEGTHEQLKQEEGLYRRLALIQQLKGESFD